MIHPSKISPLNAAPSILTRILSAPALLAEVQSLPAPALLRLVENVGLEDSSALLALATTTQLTRMLDHDLWRQKESGGAEELDPERLTVWLTALSELGPAAAAEKLAGMDEEFLSFALSRYLNALEREALDFMLINVQGDSWSDQRLEKILEGTESQEIGEVLVIAKANAPWEILQPLLLALDDHDQRLTASLLHRLCGATEARAEAEGGLFEVLSGEEMLGNDTAFSRSSRRAKKGFLSAEDAKAFRAWLDAQTKESLMALKGRDPVSRAYFREYEGELIAGPALSGSRNAGKLLELLGEEEKAPTQQLSHTAGLLPALLQKKDPHDLSRFHAELNFLAQALMLTEGEAKGDGPMRAADAARLVLERIERGITRASANGAELSAVQLFGLGSKAYILRG
jgi:hypothetical protein